MVAGSSTELPRKSWTVYLNFTVSCFRPRPLEYQALRQAMGMLSPEKTLRENFSLNWGAVSVGCSKT